MNIFLEVLLFLFYSLLFLWVINKTNFFKQSGISRFWINGLFLLKIGVGFILFIIYTKFYTVRSEADIFRYFDDSLIVYEAIWTKPLDYFRLVFTNAPHSEYFHENYYTKMNHWANPYNSVFYGDSILMIKLNAFFRLFSFGSFHVHSLFFNFLSFVGLVSIYRSFKSFIKLKPEWLLGVVFCLPSVLFWSSSVLKESILLLLIGVICFQLNKLRNNKSSVLKASLVIIIAVFFLVLLKFYLAAALIIPLVAYAISDYLKTKKVILVYLGVALFFSILFFNSSLVDVLVLKQHDFLNLVSNTNAGSYYHIAILDSNFLSIIKAIPRGILNCFIQPIPNGNLSIMAFPAILENIIILGGILLTIPQVFKHNNRKKEHTNALLFMFFFTIILFAIIGITTPVAGALVRYKVAALPFLGILILYFIQPRFKKK